MDPLTAGLIGIGMFVSFQLGRADGQKPLPPPQGLTVTLEKPLPAPKLLGVTVTKEK